MGEPPGREPPHCTSQSEEENFLVGLTPHHSLAGDLSRDLVYLCRAKAGHLGVMELNSREGCQQAHRASEVRQPDTASARTTRKDSSGMLDLRQTSPGRGLDLAVWRQPGGPGPGKPWSPLSACMAAEDLVAADVGTTGMHSGCGRSLRQTGPGQEKAEVHFPVGSLRLHSPYTAAWCWIWGGHILGKVCTEAAQVPTGNTAPQFLQPQHLSPQPRHTTA